MTPGTVPTVHEAVGHVGGIVRLTERLEATAPDQASALAALNAALDALALQRSLNAVLDAVRRGGAS